MKAGRVVCPLLNLISLRTSTHQKDQRLAKMPHLCHHRAGRHPLGQRLDPLGSPLSASIRWGARLATLIFLPTKHRREKLT